MSAQDRQTLSLPSLRNLQAFIAVANALSIHQAAEQLNVTPSAVSHQIASLESWLGKKLFIRSGKGVQLTPTGEQYLREVSAAMSAIGRAKICLTGGDRRSQKSIKRRCRCRQLSRKVR